MEATIKEQIEQADLQKRLREVQTEETRAAVEKITALRVLLGDCWVGGVEDSRTYSPILTDGETKIVKKKLFELIDRL